MANRSRSVPPAHRWPRRTLRSIVVFAVVSGRSAVAAAGRGPDQDTTSNIVVTGELVGTYGFDEGEDTMTEYAPGWGGRLRLGTVIGRSALRLSPRFTVGYLSFPNQDEPELYHGHDVEHWLFTFGASLGYRLGSVEPFVSLDAGVTAYESAGGEEGTLPGVLAAASAGVGFRVGSQLTVGPVVAIEHPRFGGLPGFSGEPQRGGLSFGLFVSHGR
jgi:hypothetical protein